MKRDMDLARQILFEIEEKATGDKRLFIKIEAHSAEEISYHVKLLAQAGLIRAMSLERGRLGEDWFPVELTWDGHEFLDDARDNTRWEKAKEYVKTNAGTLTFELLKTTLIAWGKGHLHLPN